MKKLFYISLALLLLGVTACKEEGVNFDQNAYDNIVSKAFPVENVDNDHHWETMGVATVNLSVNLKTGETYDVRIFDKNPIGSTSPLTLLASSMIANGGKESLKITYLLSQLYIFVTLYDSQKYMMVYPVLIENGVANCNIGSSTASAMSRRTGIEPAFHFASAPADADFKTSIPTDALLPSAYGDATKDALHNYKLADTEDVQNTNFYNGNFALYVSGTKNINYNQPGDGARNMYFYILPGAHLTFKYNAFTQKGSGNFKMFVCEGATVTFESGLQSYMELYNRGTVEVKGGYKPGIYDGGIFYNQGTFVINGAQSYYAAPDNIENPLTLNNSTSQFINDGTLNVGGVILEGSSHFMNNATANVSMNTVVNSNNATWVNNGEYTTNKFFYTAGSTDVINNCKLIVKDVFRINLGETDRNSFQLNGGASVDAKNFEFEGPGFIKMGSNSLFKVTGCAKFYIAKDVYGIYGPSTGANALFQAKKIERLKSWETNQGFTANYFGHLYVATDDHFNFGYSDKSAEQQAAGEVGVQPYYRLDAASGASMVTYNGANVTLSDEGCGAVYNGTPEGTIAESTPLSYRYCFEDNFPDVGDYDFNDVVLTVTPSVNDKTLTIKVSLDAVGATENVAAAMRLIGVNTSDLASYTVTQGFPSPDGQGLGTYDNIDTQETFLPENIAPNNTSSFVIILFKDAHWAINPNKASSGGVERTFFNTVKPGDFYERNVDVKTATYTLVFNDADKAKAMLAENLYDVFIVEPYNGAYWEVHTVQNGFKTHQVVTPIKPAGYEQAYGSNMPWAIMVPSSFKYPYEWQTIGSGSSGAYSGAYQTAGHSFAEWAINHNQAKDWYKYPTSGLVYE